MYPFDYHRARSIDEAGDRLMQDPGAKLLAGGMSLVPFMKLRLAQPTTLIDLCEIETLRGISVTGRSLLIRSMTSHASVAANAEVQRLIPALAALAGGIGDPHCRNRGTLGGSLAHSDPAACYPSAVSALNARVKTNLREIPADKFFLGPFDTALDAGEIVTAVEFPIPDHACYIKFPQPASRFSLAGVFLAKFGNAVRVAVTGCAAHVFRVAAFEEALSRSFASESIKDIEVKREGLSEDLYADPVYRAHLIKILTQRAVDRCNSRDQDAST
jgi:carbon-monoxide dehydrogenase medium subunit